MKSLFVFLLLVSVACAPAAPPSNPDLAARPLSDCADQVERQALEALFPRPLAEGCYWVKVGAQDSMFAHALVAEATDQRLHLGAVYHCSYIDDGIKEVTVPLVFAYDPPSGAVEFLYALPSLGPTPSAPAFTAEDYVIALKTPTKDFPHGVFLERLWRQRLGGDAEALRLLEQYGTDFGGLLEARGDADRYAEWLRLARVLEPTAVPPTPPSEARLVDQPIDPEQFYVSASFAEQVEGLAQSVWMQGDCPLTPVYWNADQTAFQLALHLPVYLGTVPSDFEIDGSLNVALTFRQNRDGYAWAASRLLDDSDPPPVFSAARSAMYAALLDHERSVVARQVVPSQQYLRALALYLTQLLYDWAEGDKTTFMGLRQLRSDFEHSLRYSEQLHYLLQRAELGLYFQTTTVSQ